MKRDIADFVAKCPNSQQVKKVYQMPSGLTYNIEDINLEFLVGLLRTTR